MASRKFLIGQIRLQIAAAIDKFGVVDVDQFVTDYVASHELPPGADADFFLTTAHDFTRRAASEVVRKWSARTAPESCPTLEGFEYLQVAYPVMRFGRQVIARIDLMTSEERRARASEYFAMGDGCYQHGHELIRYDEEVAEKAAS